MKRVFEYDESQAIEEFIADLQYRIQTLMEAKNVSPSALAEHLDVSKSRISQIFGDRPNITAQTIARIFYALGEKPVVSSPTLDSLLQATASAYRKADFCDLTQQAPLQENHEDDAEASSLLREIVERSRNAYKAHPARNDNDYLRELEAA